MKQLSKSEIKEVNGRILEEFGIEDFLGRKERVEEHEGRIIRDGDVVFFEHEGRLAPSLKLQQDFLKKITVDMGAVKFVVGGADVMRPGITKIDEGIEKGDFVLIIDEMHGKQLAVGISLLNSEDMKKEEKGKVVKTIHYVGDAIWNS